MHENPLSSSESFILFPKFYVILFSVLSFIRLKSSLHIPIPSYIIMPGQLVNVPFFSQVEDMDTYLLKYRTLKQASQQQQNHPYQAAHRYNQQVKSNNGHYSSYTNSQHQNQHQQHNNNRKKYNNGTTFTQNNNYNTAYRQQGNAIKYNQQYQQSVTSMYNKSVHQQTYSSGYYAGYNSTSNSSYSNSNIGNANFNAHLNDTNNGNDNGYSNITPTDGNSAHNSNLSLNQLNGNVNNMSQLPASHIPFSPTSSVTPPPITPSRLSSTLSSVSVGSSVSNDMDLMVPMDMNNNRSIGQQQNRFLSQQHQSLQSLPQQYQQPLHSQPFHMQQQSFPTFGSNFIEQSFSQGHDFMNPLTPSSSSVTENNDPQLPYGGGLYSSSSLSSTFMLSEPTSTWNNDSSAQPTTSSVSIWNSDMSVWS